MAFLSLPSDVVEEFLFKTPIESLVLCKPTCKQLYALCNDKRFIYNHLDLSEERLMRIYLDKIEIINPVTLDILCLPVPAEFDSVTFNVIHCDGLLLCRWTTRGLDRYNKLAVWNPISGQLKFVESFFHGVTDLYGFGYANNGPRDSYKILRVSYWRKECEIYDLKSKLWRAFSATLDWVVNTPQQNVFMNGNMYWIADTLGDNIRETFIQSFDFSKETFKPICSFPNENKIIGTLIMNGIHRIADSVILSSFRVDRLSLFRQQRLEDKKYEMEVWVTNKVTDEVVSWTKYFNVTHHPDLPILNPYLFTYMRVPTFFIHETNSIMLWCDKAAGKGFACTSFYEIGDQGEVKHQLETRKRFRANGERNPCVSSCVYVPSLVPIPE
ncbi:F-box-like domain superfamily [Arabidopsis suecica]|uniref:F-box-like domain superfamily n=1 Tax=Arabidopsis suecica TaxID=45249 RepID=A0A8T2HK22_ARASU|nr:F-box-like domain superfamily [Arabidopsis suecica]